MLAQFVRVKLESIHMSINSRMYKLWYISVMADYTAKGMNEPQPNVTIWINLSHIILSKRRQNHKVDTAQVRVYKIQNQAKFIYGY